MHIVTDMECLRFCCETENRLQVLRSLLFLQIQKTTKTNRKYRIVMLFYVDKKER